MKQAGTESKYKVELCIPALTTEDITFWYWCCSLILFFLLAMLQVLYRKCVWSWKTEFLNSHSVIKWSPEDTERRTLSLWIKTISGHWEYDYGLQ